MPEDITEPTLENATAPKDGVVWKGFHGDKPVIAVLEEDGAIHVRPLILVPDCLWGTPHWDMPIPSWASELTPEQQLAAAAVEMDGRRRGAVLEIRTILHRLRQARAAIKNGADPAEITRLIDIAGMRGRLAAAELDRR